MSQSASSTSIRNTRALPSLHGRCAVVATSYRLRLLALFENRVLLLQGETLTPALDLDDAAFAAWIGACLDYRNIPAWSLFYRWRALLLAIRNGRLAVLEQEAWVIVTIALEKDSQKIHKLSS
jgi:hypothetical protein